jgi:ABC-type transport system substrate-binding protein
MLKFAEKYPSQAQWRQFLKAPQKVLAGKEKIAFFIFLALFLFSSVFLLGSAYFKYTEIRPKKGGAFVEGVVGSPRFINPVYASVSDVDRDLVELIFSGLMKYDHNGKLILDLAKNYEIKEGGRVYEVYLKENVFWSDGAPLTADDVIFTIKTVQSSEYKSPVIVNWLGVTVEKISDLGIRFTLRNPYGPFLENLTQKIIPQHIWKDTPPENFPLSARNLKPVGSGPYKLKELKQNSQGEIVSVELVRNQRYFGNLPYLYQITFRFYSQEQELVQAYQRGQINGFSLFSTAANEEAKGLNNLNKYSGLLPRYFAVFFNPERLSILADQNVRKALNYGTNKQEIVEKILLSEGEVVQSPVLPDIYGFSPPSTYYQFDQEQAKALLEKAGFSKNESGSRIKIVRKDAAFQLKSDLRLGNRGKEVEELQRCLGSEVSGYFGEKTKEAVVTFQEKYAQEILKPWGFQAGTGVVARTTRDKLNELCFPSSENIVPLRFSLVTANQPVLENVAKELKRQWSEIGAEVEIKTFDVFQLEKEIIKPRNYEALLFGNVLTTVPDPFAFWHSSQTKDPGLNLALYQRKEVDRLLEDSRQASDDQRREKLEQLQDFIIQDGPAIFLYNPYFMYFVSTDIQGIDMKIIPDPSKRFSGIENWFIKTKRVWKLDKQ